MRTLRLGPSAALIVGLVLGTPATARAQDAAPPAPPVIVGVTGAFISDWHEFGFFGAGPLIVLPASPCDALQLSFDLTPYGRSGGTDIHAIYTVQYRHTFGRDASRPRAYITAGGAGYAHYSHIGASSYFTPERAKSVSATGVVTSTTPAHWTDVPARTQFDASLPIAPIVGIGLEGHATPRIGLEASVTTSAWPGIAWRFSGGFTIAVGHLK